MARTKARWTGRILRNMFLDGGSIVLMARVDHDPDRVVELRINRSSVDAFLKAVARVAEVTEEGNGKHAADEF